MSEAINLTGAELAEYERFIDTVNRKTGIDLKLYKHQQMYRRLQALVTKSGCKNFAEYAGVVEKDPQALASFLDRMTINVSELFRNSNKWDELRNSILPKLMRAGRPLRIWSAGCSFGAEPYSLAITLDEMTPNQKHYLLATDIDEIILGKARQGLFMETDMNNVTPANRTKYFAKKDGGYQVIDSLKSRITFKRHNLLKDPFESDFDLIVCRNVVIYFTDDAKSKLYRRFSDSLRPGGVLFVGGTECIFNHREFGLEAEIPFFYERVSSRSCAA